MIAKLEYSKIKSLTLLELLDLITNTRKGKMTDVVPKDILHNNELNKSLPSLRYDDIFSKGVYLFFERNNRLRYVGKSKNGFYGRFLNQIDTTHKAFWGWNVILSKMVTERNGSAQEDQTQAEYEREKKILLTYTLIVIEDDLRILSDQQFGSLERFLMRIYNEHGSANLLNKRFGSLKQNQIHMTIEDLL